jgi:hypothetical protein
MLTEDYSEISKDFRPGELLWHYTGFKGLEGILNGDIWASSAIYLNDTQEFRYAVRVAIAVLEEERQAHHGEFEEAALSVIRFFEGVDGKTSFVASFSEQGDDLSQWRAYEGEGRHSPSGLIQSTCRQGRKSSRDSEVDSAPLARIQCC